MLTILYIISFVVLVFIGLQLLLRFKSSRQKGKSVNLDELSNSTKNTIKNKRALLYFYSPSCGPCKVQSPIMERLKKENHNVAMIDISKNIKDAKVFGVMATPTTILVQNNVIMNIFIGYKDEAFLKKQFSF